MECRLLSIHLLTMPKKTSIDWGEVAGKLDRAPDDFLRIASKSWKSRLGKKKLQKSQRSAQDEHYDSIRKDAQQQEVWKEAHESVNEELLFSGEFTDKGEYLRLLQRVKLVKRTAKQIHIVAAYTLYSTTVIQGDEPVAWSKSPDGDLFGNFYRDWKPVIRYRLLRISRAKLYVSSGINSFEGTETTLNNGVSIKEWRRLCGMCLFSNEQEYAEWHLTRYEGKHKKSGVTNTNTCDLKTRNTDPYVLLGLPPNTSQAEIKAAYKRMAMKHHPDRGGDSVAFHKIKTAYNSLNGVVNKMNSS